MERKDFANHMVAFMTAYNLTNAPFIDILTQEPTPVQFLRYVAKNRPFVLKGGCSNWLALQKWNMEYLIQRMQGSEDVEIAVTPDGYGNSNVA